jgi:carotenoid cleavage dioxygenase-like enzyme
MSESSLSSAAKSCGSCRSAIRWESPWTSAQVAVTNTNLAGFQTLNTETRDAQLEWQGTPPAWLNGVLLRTGPAKFEVGKTAFRHLFDGLAMLHRFAFAGGGVRYANRFLQSAAYREAIARNAIARDEFATNRAGPLGSLFATRLTGKQTDNGNVNVIALRPRHSGLDGIAAPAADRCENARNPLPVRMVRRTHEPGHDRASAL